MNPSQKQAIEQEADRLYPIPKRPDNVPYMQQQEVKNETFIDGATFGLSLNEWVSVTPETMPEKSGQYLGCEDWNKTGKPFVVYFDKEDNVFYQNCTHWMQLPTPPNK